MRPESLWIALPLLLLTACAPATLLNNPRGWPDEWAGRALYTTPSAYIYASSENAAGEADRLVTRRAQRLRDETGRQPARGLIVVTDRGDGLFTSDVESLLIIAAKGAVKPGTDEALVDLAIKTALARFDGLTSSLGVETKLVHRVATLPLSPKGIASLMELDADEAEQPAWGIAMPTKEAQRQALWEAAPDFLEQKCGIGPVAQIALAPLVPWAEAFAMDKLSRQCREMVDRQLRLADPELADFVEPVLGSRMVMGSARGPLERGDRILSIDGKPVTDLDDLTSALSGKRIDATLEMIVEREGKRIALTVPIRSFE
jgi:hypothetical protein